MKEYYLKKPKIPLTKKVRIMKQIKNDFTMQNLANTSMNLIINFILSQTDPFMSILNRVCRLILHSFLANCPRYDLVLPLIYYRKNTTKNADLV